ncbi:hypothetical protein QFC21_005901 [Naganishia friedmannii]|uniref:Uncharacterized protein n=1 Tax=Naganishia friedmannii TaxID=89922 RepID=A0ACC2V6N1_9TREE|nr:hypothetical protein QFC21_005901 [Naganishia friedmannii]
MSSHASAENRAFDHVDDSATNNDMNLPYDLIIKIAKQLAYQGCMRTVASLNAGIERGDFVNALRGRAYGAGRGDCQVGRHAELSRVGSHSVSLSYRCA